jgi:hypothetical protein
MTTYFVSMKYGYEIEADSVEDAENQAREQFAEDLGSIHPREFGCEVE